MFVGFLAENWQYYLILKKKHQPKFLVFIYPLQLAFFLINYIMIILPDIKVLFFILFGNKPIFFYFILKVQSSLFTFNLWIINFCSMKSIGFNNHKNISKITKIFFVKKSGLYVISFQTLLFFLTPPKTSTIINILFF